MSQGSHVSASGRITRGISPNTFVNETIKFVENQLHVWRDDKRRPYVEAEEDLNGQLCKFLNDRARDDFPMALFQHEERQGKRRRIDLSVLPSSKAIVAAIYESIYEPFLVIEGKRLPAPSKGREREYLTGFDKKSGGIQRFRLCLHGKSLVAAVMVGYVQTSEVEDWLMTINGWIAALKSSGEDKTCVWSDQDQLGELQNDGKARASRCESRHLRLGDVPEVRLTHLWICMAQEGNRTARKQKPSQRRA
ncbi:MAG: hypothetical protein ACR2FY_13140 [Pirellulaceae bacterium]